MRVLARSLLRAAIFSSMVSVSSFALATTAPALSERHRFDVPAQGLGEALLAISKQSSIRILFDYDAVNHHRSRGLKGMISTNDALSKLLSGTPLRATLAGDRTVAVHLMASASGSTRGMPVSLVAASTGQDDFGAPAANPAEQEDNSPPPSDIIVTGTRRQERTIAQSLAPIDVVDAKSLALSPAYDLNDRLAQMIPSFNVQRVPGADGVIFSRPASLRNLGPDETLVLVNGHRRHRSAFVDIVNQGSQAIDLAQIPSPAVGRIEVLRDGASAQYGSDAIAGVINIVLDDSPGTALSAQAGQYYVGDGFNVILSGRTGLALPGGGTLAVAGDYNKSEATNRSVGIRNKIGQPDSKSYHFTYDLKLPLSDAINLYSFGTYGHTNGWSEFSFRSQQARDTVFRRSFFQDGPNAIFPNWTLTSLYPNGFASQFGAVIVDGEALVGLKSELAPNLTIDVSGGYGRNSINYKVRGSINASLGPLSPTSFDSGKVVASETTASVDMAYLLDVGLAKPVSIAFGGQYRNEEFESIAGDVASYQIGPLSDLLSGAFGFPGLTPDTAGSASRNSKAGYVDIEADLTEWLTLGAAGRYEHFSDFGSNFSYKLSGRYQLAEPIALRATYSTGFHAPTPGQQFFTKISTSPDASAPPPFPIIRIALLSPSDPLAVQFGGKALKAETSRNVSAGIVFQPASGLTLTADYYHIKIDDRIGLTSQLRLPAGSLYDRIQFLINGYDTKSDGVDVVASWTQRLFSGRGTLTAAYNYNRTKISKLDPSVINAVSRPTIEDARPHHTVVATAGYDGSRIHLLARVRYYGSYVDALPFDQSAFGFQNQKVSPITFVDLSASYDILPKTQITVGTQNLFDVRPDRATSILKVLGHKYPLFRAYDADGGQWYVRLAHRF